MRWRLAAISKASPRNGNYSECRPPDSKGELRLHRIRMAPFALVVPAQDFGRLRLALDALSSNQIPYCHQVYTVMAWMPNRSKVVKGLLLQTK